MAAGLAVLGGDLLDLVRALIVPRPYTSGPVAGTLRALRSAYLRVAARSTGDPRRRDVVLATGEPLLLLLRMALWMAIGVVGFTLLSFAAGGNAGGGVEAAFVESGSSVFTLGFANGHGTASHVVDFLGAAFGLTVITLQIAYLPALYDAFNRRETLVTMLESRAGAPAWGPELLARHHLVGIAGNLPALYADWERWSADVAESHTTYPVLLWLRSPHPANSWVVGLVSVLDAAALQLAFNPSTAPAEARLCLRMGFTALRDIAQVMGIDFDPDPLPGGPLRLTFTEFTEAAQRLRRAQVPLERAEVDAWPHFRGWRVNYESTAYAVAAAVAAPPGPWSGPRPFEGPAPKPARPVDRRPGQPQGTPEEEPPAS